MPNGSRVMRWLAFDHPGSPGPVGLLRVLADGGVEYLDRDGRWHVDPALTPDLLAAQTRDVPEAEAARIAERLRAGRPTDDTGSADGAGSADDAGSA